METWIVFATALFLLLGLGFTIFRVRSLEKKKHAAVLEAFAQRDDFNSPEELFWYTAREVVSRLGFSDCVIYRLDHEKKVCIQVAASGPKAPAGNAILRPIEIPFGKGIVGSVAVSGRPEIIGKATGDPRYIPDDDVRCSELTVPVIINGKAIAIIDSEEKPVDHFRPYDLELISQAANILAGKLAKLGQPA
jgi:signal transduction protein with GAF and PtsI domain